MKTISICNSEEVLAVLGTSGTLYRGKWQNIKVTQIGKDDYVPFEVRKSLVGLVVPTIFEKSQSELQGVDLYLPDNSRLSYCGDVVKVLKSAEKFQEATWLEAIVSNPLDIDIFEEGIYNLYP